MPAPAAWPGTNGILRLAEPKRLGMDETNAWSRLADEAEAPSIFAEPWFMRCSFEHCDIGNEARLAIVEDQDGEWLGAIPVAVVARQGRTPLPAWRAWGHPNQFVGTPLVRRGAAKAFWRVLLEGLGRSSTGRIALCLRDLPLDDPTTLALLELCREEGRGLVVDRQFARARLSTEDGLPQLGSKQRGRLGGLERKLEREVGPVTVEIVRDAERVDETVAAFLDLEQAGWKGAAGSAMACAEETSGFLGAVAEAAAARGRFEAAILRAGGRVIAISTQLIGRGWAYGFKAAYDERYARHAPGLLLLNRLTQSFVERAVGEVDSCAAPDQQPVSRLWPARRELIDCRVALGRALHSRAFSAMLACEALARKWEGRRRWS